MKTKPLHRAAFTLVEIMIVVAIIGLLAAIAVPNFVRARATAQANACINNMRQIDGAINQWALENGKQSADAVTLDNCKPYIKLNSAGNIPSCPAGGAYTVTTVGASPSVTCSLNAAVPPHVMP